MIVTAFVKKGHNFEEVEFQVKIAFRDVPDAIISVVGRMNFITVDCCLDFEEIKRRLITCVGILPNSLQC